MASEPTPQGPDEEQKPSALKRAQKTYGLVSDIITPQRIGLFLAFALLAGIGLFGGWDAAVTEVDTVPRGEPSVAAAAAPFEVTLRRVRYGNSLDPVFRARDGVRYWFVSMDVVNTSDLPVERSILTDDVTVDIPGLAASAPGRRPESRTVRLNDSLDQRTFQPDVLTPIALVWEQDAAAEIPAEVTVTLATHTWRASSMDGGLDWRDPEPGLIVTMPADPLGEG